MGLADDRVLFTAGVAMVIDSTGSDRRLAGGDGSRPSPTSAPIPSTSAHGRPNARYGRAERRAHPRLLGRGVRIVILTTFDTDECVIERGGRGRGFLLKNTPPEELLRPCAPSIAATPSSASSTRAAHARAPLRRRSPVRPPRGTRRAVESLTPRERGPVAMALGHPTPRSAALVLSMPTVKTHVGHVLAKTGSRDRVQAVLFAFRAGLVDRQDLLREA